MAQFDLQLPKFGESDLDDAKQRRRIMSYLYKLDEQLRFVLNNLDAENFTEEFQQTVGSGGGGGMTSYTELENELGKLSTQIRQTAALIELKADAEELDEMGEAIAEVNATLTVLQGEITSKVSRTEYNALSKRVETAESTISQTADQIRAEVTDEVNSLQSQISQSAEQIRTEVTNTVNGLQSQIDQTPEQIELAVKGIQVGGTQLIRRSQALPTGAELAAADRWRLDTKVSTYQYNDRFAALKFYETGATEAVYKNAYSPVGLLPAGWQGQKVTLSAYVYSPNWSAVDSNFRCSVRLNQGGTSVMNYGARTLVAAGGVISSQANETGTLKNKKWTRVSATFDLTAEELSSGTGVLGDNTHVYVGFSLWKNGDVRLYAPKLEMGNKATDWSPAPDDPVDGIQAGTTVTINKEEFKVRTPEFNVEIPTEDGTETMLRIGKDGVFTPKLDSPSVAQRYDGPYSLTVSSAATEAQVTAGTHVRSLAEVANNLSDKHVGKQVNITVAAGHVEYGAVRFRGITGSYWVQIVGDASKPAKVVGTIECSFNSAPMLFRNIDVEIDPNVSANGYHAEGSSTTVTIRNCVITGQGVSGAGSTRAIIASRNACVYAYENELYHCQRSYYAQIAGTIAAYTSKGNCTVGANRATMYLTGTMPCADPDTWTVSTSAGQVLTGNVSVDQGSYPSASTPTHTTVSYSSTNADTYAGGGWNNYSNSDIYQGYTTGLGEHRGCFWFDNASIRSALKNKTIKQATLTLYQVGGVGRNLPVQVSLDGITVTSGTGNQPTGEPEYKVIGTTLGVNQATTFALPVKVITDLANGTINGLMLRTGETSVMKNDDNSYNYARFAGGASNANRPVLTVVYTV